MTHIKKSFKIIMVTAILSISLFQVQAVIGADNLGSAFTKIEDKKIVGADGMGYNTSKSFYSITGAIIQTFLSLLGIIFLVLMLYGGYLWMTDRGESKSVEKAQNVIRAAVIGLFIVLISYSISYFVIKKFGDETLNGGSTTDSSSDNSAEDAHEEVNDFDA